MSITTAVSRGARHALTRSALRRRVTRAEQRCMGLDAQIEELAHLLVVAASEHDQLKATAAEALAARDTYAAALSEMARRLTDSEERNRALGHLELANTALRAQLAQARTVSTLGATAHPSGAEVAAGERSRADTVEMPTLTEQAAPRAAPGGSPADPTADGAHGITRVTTLRVAFADPVPAARA